jgi:hypothetical protein
VPEHFEEVAFRRIAHVDKVLAAVHERLTREITFWSDRWRSSRTTSRPARTCGSKVENVRRTVNDLQGRLEIAARSWKAMRHVTSSTPVVLGGALVVPAGLLRKLRGTTAEAPTFSADAAARRRIELAAMAAVRRVEEARGCKVVDVSAEKCGWDLTSYPPPQDGASFCRLATSR